MVRNVFFVQKIPTKRYFDNKEKGIVMRHSILISITALAMAGCTGTGVTKPQGPEPKEPEPTPEIAVESRSIDMEGKEPITLQSDTFTWDLDGDGAAETFFVDITDNGDEAPNVMEIGSYDHDWIVLYVDGGYGIKELAGIPDAEDRRIEVIYYTGSYDFSGFENRGYLRLAEDHIVLETIEPLQR